MHGPTVQYFRPLSYAHKSVTGRLASRTIPHDVRAHKAGQEAGQRGQPVDIHDPRRLDRNDYDILIPDIDVRKLKNRLRLGKKPMPWPKLTSDLFGITPRHVDISAAVVIAGHHHIAYRAPQHSHFAEVDILGTHFLDAHGVSLVTDFAALRARLFFGDMAWKVLVEGAKL
ncbi:hypothetical protein HOY80DRAFT_1040232 [Tuber brumale]|nr:hypothetical protein HOY80DRAFT_1040232 [Tuber brumale]